MDDEHAPDDVQSQAYYTFDKSIGEWLGRFLPDRTDDNRPDVNKIYKQYEPFFRAAWAHLCRRDYDKDTIIQMLQSKTVSDSLVLEQEENTRDHVVRLYAIYEKFLSDLRNEIYGATYAPKGEFGNWLFRLLTGEETHKPTEPPTSTIRNLRHHPLGAILPMLPTSASVEDNVAQYEALRNLELKHSYRQSKGRSHGALDNKFSITKDPHTQDCVLTWTDWHCFLYGVRNCEGHGALQKTLGDHGCLHEERRKKIRDVLDKIIKAPLTDEFQEDQHQQKIWAKNMIRLLTDMEYRLWKEQGSPIRIDEPKDPVGDVPWNKFLGKLKEGAAPRTEFEECLSYSVKLWIPRMMRSLSNQLVISLRETCKLYKIKREQENPASD